MAQSGDFLAKIKLVLEGKEQTVSGLQQTQQAAQQLSKTKVTTIFDKEGLVSGKKLEETFSNIKDQTKKATPLMNQFGLAMQRALIVAPVWMASRWAIQAVTETIGEQIKFLKELDTAMARIQIVGQGTKEEYEGLKNTLVSLSVTYGTLSSAALDAAVIFAQQGRTVDETIKLTRAAMVASQVLGSDMRTTVDDLTAAIEGFNIPIEDSISIIDKWINVERQFAVTSKDLADATKVTGATANQMGISINAFLGDVTAVIEVTRKTGSEAARALQFIYARLLTTGAKSLTQIAKIPIYLDKSKKATFELTNTYRSATDVLDELAGKWDVLTNKEKLSIAENIASKRQLTVFMALMQNYNASLNARIAALNSTGRAEIAFGIIQETVAVKMQRLGASWNNLTNSIADTSAWKSTLDSLSAILVAIADTVNKQQELRRVGTEQQDVLQKEFETQKSQIKNLQELLQLRNEYLSRPPTDRNTEMLGKINEAIKNVQDSGKVFIDVDTKDAINKLDILSEVVAKRQITADVNVKFDTKKKVLEQQLKELFKITPIDFTLGLSSFEDWNIKNQKRLLEIKAIQQELNNLGLERTAELTKNLSNLEQQKLAIQQSLEYRQAQANIENTLTEEDAEKLDIESKLNSARQSGVLTTQQLLDLEIKLVENSMFTLDQYQKRLKISELEAQRTAAIQQDRSKLISHELELLKIRGANLTQLTDAETALKIQLYGYDAIKNSLEYQFNLEKRITKEKMNQVDIGNDTIALYKIAKKYGDETAKAVSKVIMGKQTWQEFQSKRTGTKAQEAFSEFFSQREEELNAAQYFNLIPGDFYKTSGRRIPVPETQTPQMRNLDELSKKFNVGVLPLANRPVSIQSLQVNVSTTKEDLKTTEEQAKQMQIDIADAIRNDPKIKEAINEQIAEF